MLIVSGSGNYLRDYNQRDLMTFIDSGESVFVFPDEDEAAEALEKLGIEYIEV